MWNTLSNLYYCGVLMSFSLLTPPVKQVTIESIKDFRSRKNSLNNITRNAHRWSHVEGICRLVICLQSLIRFVRCIPPTTYLRKELQSRSTPFSCGHPFLITLEREGQKMRLKQNFYNLDQRLKRNILEITGPIQALNF